MRPRSFILERVRRIEELCEAPGVSLAAAALQFSLGQRAVISVLSGMRSRNEVMNNIRLMSEELPKAFWADLRERELISPDVPTP